MIKLYISPCLYYAIIVSFQLDASPPIDDRGYWKKLVYTSNDLTLLLCHCHYTYLSSPNPNTGNRHRCYLDIELKACFDVYSC
jgi:hypothetical protein